MRRAWKVDLFSGTISPIPAKGIACVNEGLWCLNDAGFRSFYGSNGSYAGSSITRNGHTTFTDGGGRYVGSSIRSGRTTTIYDRTGSRTGSIARTGR